MSNAFYVEQAPNKCLNLPFSDFTDHPYCKPWPWNKRLVICLFNDHFSLYPLPGRGSCQVTLVRAQKRPRFSPPWGVRASLQRAIPAQTDP